VDEMGGTSSKHGDMKNACRNSLVVPNRKGTLGRTSSECEDNIKIYLKEIGYEVDFSGYGNEPCGYTSVDLLSR
jgi:hypothetical protein